jgi:hypothetical protein
MVLENFLRKLMEKYLSDILDDVDCQELSLQLLKGEVTLDDVKVKPSFLKSLALPFPFPIAFHRAVIKHVRIAVNWKLITSQPLLVTLSGIHLWAEGKAYDALIGADSAYIQHQLAKAIQEKLEKLQREEEIRLAIAEYGEAEGPKKPSVLLARLIGLVTTSLQLTVQDLHVCISLPGVDEHPGLHMGLALEELKFETTDSSWASVPLHLITGPTYKSLTIKNLSLYLNPDPRADELAKDKQNANEEQTKENIKNMPSLPPEVLPSPEVASAAEVAASLNVSHIYDPQQERATYQFILKPTSLGLNMTFNKNLIPTVEVHTIIDLPALQLCLTRPQMLTILHLKETVKGRTDQVKKWLEKQPPHPPITDFQQKRYMFLYKRTLNALWLPELDEAEVKEKEDLERELPYEELNLMRQAATLELKKELGKKENISDREDAIAKRTHWWDKLFRSEDSIKNKIEGRASPEHQLTEEQKTKILNKVRKEGTDEEELEEADSFSIEDLLKVLTFHVSAELNVGEMALELWHDKTKKELPEGKAPGETSREEDLKGENIIAVAAREQRKRDDKEEPNKLPSSSTPQSSHPQAAQRPQIEFQFQRVDEGKAAFLPDAALPAGLVLNRTQRRHFEGESLGSINLRPLMRLQINKTTIGLELEPDGDMQVDASIDSIQLLDLSLCKATDPWSSVIHPLDERVEFGYIGPIIPQGPRTAAFKHSTVVDVNKPNTVVSVAPSSTPVGVMIRLRRSKEMMNSDQRNARLLEKSTQKESSSKEGLTSPSSQKKGNAVTDILFGSEDKEVDSNVQHKGEVQPKQISPAIMFSHSVAVRTSADLQINNLRLSFTDSVLEIADFIRSPPAPFLEKVKDRMEKGEDLPMLDSAQQESDKQQKREGGEIRRDEASIALLADPKSQKQHVEDVQQIEKAPIKAVVTPHHDQQEDQAKDKKDRLEKEKKAVEKAVKVVPEGQPETPQSAAGEAGTHVEKPAGQQTIGDTKEDEVGKKPVSSLSFLSFFSPMLVRLHAPSPYISLIPDTAARQLQRLTVSLNCNARALLDGQADSIHARADVTNVRGWVAKTEAFSAISLAPFNPPTKDSNYVIKPFNIGMSFERYPSPLQQLMGKVGVSERREAAKIEEAFRKEVRETVDMDEEDIETIFEAEDSVYHMDADLDISAIHIKLAAKMWYMLQPFINRVKRRMDENDV